MAFTVAIVGRPNVGKSTLFNRLCGTRQALVADIPGLTRDRQYAAGTVGDRPYLVVDTGGLTGWSSKHRRLTTAAKLSDLMQEQVQHALGEADSIVFMVDGREGLSSIDAEIADVLRRQAADVWLAVNKVEGLDPTLATVDFHALGLGEPIPISATRGDGVQALMQQVLDGLPRVEETQTAGGTPVIAIAGRPNVGDRKSTRLNSSHSSVSRMPSSA